MRTGSDREALRRVADLLCAEFAAPSPGRDTPATSTEPAEASVGTPLDPHDEELLARLREALSGVASRLGPQGDRPPVLATETALAGSEFVLRRALDGDKEEHILELLPSFVFLVALSVADRDQALEASERAAALIEGRAP